MNLPQNSYAKHLLLADAMRGDGASSASRRPSLWAAVSLGAVVPLLVPLSAPAAVSNAEAAALSANCYTCHGPGGVSPGSIPSIDGKTVEYVLGKLRGFRDGTAENTVMSRIAKGYSDEQLQAIAAFLVQSR